LKEFLGPSNGHISEGIQAASFFEGCDHTLIVTPYEDVGISDMLTVYEPDSKFDGDGLEPTDITRWTTPSLIGAPEGPSGIPK
jgi:hypothetical protein